MELVWFGIGAFLLLIIACSDRVQRFFQAPNPHEFRSRKNLPWVSRGFSIPKPVSVPSMWNDEPKRAARQSPVRVSAADKPSVETIEATRAARYSQKSNP